MSFQDKPNAQNTHAIDGHKLHLHPERVAAWARAQTIEEKLAIPPIYVEISPVGHCNHRCTFCAVDYIGYKVRRIETNVLSRTLVNIAELGVKSVMFAGEGEPMLHPDIAYLTVTAKQCGLDVAFTTNGTVLTEKFVDKALDFTTWIKVSMNGGSKSYATIHQTKPEDYERVWRNLEYAVKQRSKNSGNCTIGIQCVCLPENLGCLEELASRASEAGIDYLVLKPYSQHKSSNTKQYESLKYDGGFEYFASKLGAYNSESFKVIIRREAVNEWNQHEHSYTKCNATPYFWAYIMATGDVYSCSAYLLNPEFHLGSIGEQSFREIWTGPKRRDNIRLLSGMDISRCRLNCRMNQVNKYLWELEHPNAHVNFI